MVLIANDKGVSEGPTPTSHHPQPLRRHIASQSIQRQPTPSAQQHLCTFHSLQRAMSLSQSLPRQEILDDVAVSTGLEVREVSHLMEGRSHEVYKITVGEEGKPYCLRVPKNESALATARRGLEVLKCLKNLQPALQAPAVIYESDRYAILQYLEGGPIRSWNTTTLTQDRRQTLVKSLAAFLFTLWTSPIEIDGATPRNITYSDWRRDEVYKGFLRSIDGTGWDDPIHFLRRGKIAQDLVPKHDDTETAPKHGDLNAWNVLVDTAGLTGVIDWDTAQVIPLPSAVQHPMFMADIPGWRNDDVPGGMTFRDDRKSLEHEMRRLAATSTKPAARRIPGLLSTSYERHFLELSLPNKRVNREYIRLQLASNPFSKAQAAEQLRGFLDDYPDIQRSPAVTEFSNKLLLDST
ncbi:hypothetical protein CTA2_7971 [Colletotrichum tanaceti]|nr:hypothetical protein CTA2_7971 [Colletotrichum tanaceti]